MNRENFKATIEDTDIWGINSYLGISKDFDIETGKPTVYVSFELEPEARDWGIKSIYVFVSNVKCSVEWETDSLDLNEEEKAQLIAAGGTEYRNETIGGTIEIDTFEKLKGKEWEITNECKFESDGQFMFGNCEIDFDKMTITLT